jgi:hypothetical protein
MEQNKTYKLLDDDPNTYPEEWEGLDEEEDDDDEDEYPPEEELEFP